MSSHREAPEISKDPVADNTDVYAFVSTNPNEAGTVTIITNYVPLEGPDGGPNFYEFGNDVLYEINIDNDQDAQPEIIYQFQFHIELQNPNTFLYNTGPISSLTDPNWNRRQFYSVTKVVPGSKLPGQHGSTTVLATNLACPPVNVGVRSTPNYETNLGSAAVHTLPTGEKVFAGQRLEGFYVDLGSIFDLAALRPFQSLHLIHPPNNADGVDATKNVNVHTIAIQVPISQLTSDGSTPTNPMDPKAVLGIYGSASRRKATIRDSGKLLETGPFVQVSRLGNPLFNEVIVPMSLKDLWNSLPPVDDSQFAQFVKHPELARLLPVLYPGVFPHLAAFNASDASRDDLVAILLTGIPSGIIPGFQNTTGSTLADLLRLNMAIPPTSSPNRNGILGGDLAGFPNGRRVFDDVATIEIRAIAGVTLPLVDHSFNPDGAASLVSDFSDAQFSSGQVPGSDRYIDHFPYLGVPRDGFDTPSS